MPNEEVTSILKINDQLLLASTSKGYVLQINIDNDIKIKRKFIDSMKIILVSGNGKFYVLSIEREVENNSQKCEIF